MSELVQLRQRIKAVEKIKKITHAMRIISMSIRARLRAQQESLEEYKATLASLFFIAQHHAQHEDEPLLQSPESATKKLLILLGSQKGLCGNFNTLLFDFFERHYAHYDDYDIITVGAKAHEFIKIHKKPLYHFDDLTMNTIGTIAKQLTDVIISTLTTYQTTTVVSNFPKTFFIQKPRETGIIPFSYDNKQPHETRFEDYQFEEDDITILSKISQQLIFTMLYQTIVDSLVAEQSARFIAMDNSTRNAGNLLDAMNLRYNKTRQAKITRELTDLAASL